MRSIVIGSAAAVRNRENRAAVKIKVVYFKNRISKNCRVDARKQEVGVALGVPFDRLPMSTHEPLLINIPFWVNCVSAAKSERPAQSTAKAVVSFIFVVIFIASFFILSN